MNHKNIRLGLSLAFIISLSACTSTPERVNDNPIQNSLPDWVLNPPQELLSATHCVPSSGRIDIDTKKASAGARTKLAQSVNTRVDAIDKSLEQEVISNGQNKINSEFASASKQVTSEALTGSRITKSEFVSIRGVDHFCTLAVLDPQKTETLFNDLLALSQSDVNGQGKAKLYQEFKAQKAYSNLEQAISAILD